MVGDFGDGFQGDRNNMDNVLQMAGLDRCLDCVLYFVLIAGIGMDDIPFSRIRHDGLTALHQGDQALDDERRDAVENPNENTDDQYAKQDDQGVVADLLGGGIHDLLELALGITHIFADPVPGTDKPVLLFVRFCHLCYPSFAYLVSV